MKDWVGIHGLQHHPMSTFITLMGKDCIVEHSRIELGSSQHTSCHDESIHQYHHTFFSSLKHTTNGSHHLKTAKPTNDFLRIGREELTFHSSWHKLPILGRLQRSDGLYARQSLKVLDGFGQNRIFMLNSFAVQSSPSTYTFIERNILEEIHPNGGRRGVAYAHFTKGNDIASRRNTIVHMLHTYLDGSVEFLLTHCRFVAEVFGAVSNFMIIDRKLHSQIVVVLRVDNVGRKIMVNTHINQSQEEIVLMTKHIHTTSTTAEIQQLLPSDLARRDAHTFSFDAVVSSKQSMALMIQFRTERVLNQSYL